MENYEKKDFRKLYEDLVNSDWFKKVYHDKSLGECPIDIPELRESEDEKIIDDAIQIIRASRLRCAEYGSEADKHLKAIAYLEKQKEASKAIEAVERIDSYITEHTANSWEMDDSNPDKKYYCGVDDTLSNIAGILQGVYAKQKEQDKCPEYCVRSHCIGCSIYEKQKEQKPLKVGENAYFDPNTDMWFIKKEQKPAEWSDDIIRKAVKEVGLTQHQIDWFKTNVFLPKQEWSEEDEDIRQSIIKDIEWERNYTSATTVLLRDVRLGKVIEKYNEQINWLKSLRPHPKWKPSEEQMNSLNYGIYVLEEEGYDASASEIKELYEQLKKLMED